MEKGVGDVDFWCELKIDGVAIALTFEDGAYVRGATRGDDQAWTPRRAPQCIYPPRQIAVCVLAQHGQHDVPPRGGELAHGQRQFWNALELNIGLRGPLFDVLEHPGGPLGRDRQDAQHGWALLVRCVGQAQGFSRNRPAHAIIPAPPTYRATSTNASSVPLP